MKNNNMIDRFLSVLTQDILPLTKKGIVEGNKVFGAAILEKSTFNLVTTGTNNEIVNPLLHGEISCINNYWAMSEKERPTPEDCLFLSTHEPCSLCLSAITWSGFDNFYYLFSYEDSRDEFNIPHDLNILKEVFNCGDGNYAKINYYWCSYSLMALIINDNEAEKEKWLEQISKLRKAYGMMSKTYQKNKTTRKIPLA